MQIDKYSTMQEEELKSAVMADFFKDYKYTQLGKIDFVIMEPESKTGQLSLNISKLEKSFLWAEAKKGSKKDIYESFVQLILTIGKAKTYEKYLPPKFLGAIDAEKCAFIEYSTIQNIFYMNDFNWNVTSSDHDTKEFKLLYDKCKGDLEKSSYIFNYNKNLKEFKKFIKQNFNISDGVNKIAVTKNNFTFVYMKWCEKVKPSIDIKWEEAKKVGIIDSDFFLADLISEKDESLKENLYVILKKTNYKLARKITELNIEASYTVFFNDKQKAYREFWSIYERPPKKEYWDDIINRRDLLVPQDIREKKGSYFTPRIWVEKSQQYIKDVLGENWQDEYVVWDCCAGTGNLLNGLINKKNIWASTLDQSDVDVMKDRIQNGWNMYEDHVFQFDFLNDSFSKLPEKLKNIINDKEKRKKLLIYINPPYAEGDNIKGIGRKDVSNTKIKEKYSDFMGYSKKQLYIQFITRIYKEIKCEKLALFSSLTYLKGVGHAFFRSNFKAKLNKIFIIPSKTFDNVNSNWDIGFQIWNLNRKSVFLKEKADVYDNKGNFITQKELCCYNKGQYINDWTKSFIEQDKEYEKKNSLANIIGVSNDFFNQKTVRIENPNRPWNHQYQWQITKNNLLESAIYFAVRLCMKVHWYNMTDQFLYPNKEYLKDLEFQNNCLIYMLFHNKNNITSKNNINHWIPFKEEDVNCTKEFDSHFMIDFLNGKLQKETLGQLNLFNNKDNKSKYNRIVLSKEAQDVFCAGKELWKYYHSKSNILINASYYDIREYFQGKNNKGELNKTSSDKQYLKLLKNLKDKIKLLEQKIEPKLYDYGFLIK